MVYRNAKNKETDKESMIKTRTDSRSVSGSIQSPLPTRINGGGIYLRNMEERSHRLTSLRGDDHREYKRDARVATCNGVMGGGDQKEKSKRMGWTLGGTRLQMPPTGKRTR